ncbi:MAG TPA: hypothetical protein PLP40_07215, partial [Trichococcus flocculiformis]|nr:hypothetical protein [Trichococcus flocculiformis]
APFFVPKVRRMSDSLGLSDNRRPERMPNVRFISVIEQPSIQMCSKHNSETRKPDKHMELIHFTQKIEDAQHPHAERLRFF